MRNNAELTEATRQYTEAYSAHYTTRNLPLAMQLYQQVITSHPSDRVAEYSRDQIQNIVKAVIPKQNILDAQIDLALSHFQTCL